MPYRQLDAAAKAIAAEGSSTADAFRRFERCQVHLPLAVHALSRRSDKVELQIGRIGSEGFGLAPGRWNSDAYGAPLSAIMEICSPCSVSSACVLRRWEKKFALSA